MNPFQSFFQKVGNVLNLTPGANAQQAQPVPAMQVGQMFQGQPAPAPSPQIQTPINTQGQMGQAQPTPQQTAAPNVSTTDVLSPITNAVNQAGSAVGNAPEPYDLPTITQFMNFLTAGKQGIGNKILSGKASREDIAQAIPLIIGSMGGVEGEAGTAAPSNGDQFLAKDMPAFENRTAAQIKAGAGQSNPQFSYVPGGAMNRTPVEAPETEQPAAQAPDPFQNTQTAQAAPVQPAAPVEAPAQPSTAWREFSDQQKEYQAPPAQKAIRQINPATFAKENDPVGTVNAIHETLDRYGINNPTAEEQLSVLPQIRNSIYKDAVGQIEADPANAPLKTVTDNINRELSGNTRLKDITAPAAKDAIDGYTQNLYNEATGTATTVIPTEIPYKTLLEMKSLANKDYAKIVQKNLNNQPLTDTEKVNQAYRNGLDKTITARYPGVKQDTMDMSNLYKAQTPLAKAVPKYEAPPPVESPQTGWQKAATVGKALVYPAFAVAEGAKALHDSGLGPAMGVAGGKMFDGLSKIISNGNAANEKQYDKTTESGEPYNAKNDIHGNSMTPFDTDVNTPSKIPQDAAQLNTGSDGNYYPANIFNWKQADGKTPQYISQTTYDDMKSKQAAVVKSHAQLYAGAPWLKTQDDATSAQIEAQWEKSKPIASAYDKTKQANSSFVQAENLTRKSGGDLANLNQSYDQFQANTDPQYSKLKGQLKDLASQGYDLKDVVVGPGLLSQLQTLQKQTLMNMYTNLGTNAGYTGQGTTGVQTVAPASTPVPATNPGFNIMDNSPKFQDGASPF